MKPTNRTRILALLLGLALGAISCGPFNTCVKPYTSQITWTGTASELGEVVAQFLLCDGGLNAAEIPACAVQSLDTLAMSLGPDGTAIVNCIIAYYETNGSATLQARAKAVGAKRGVSPAACNETSKPSPEIGTGPEPSRGTTASPWIGVDRPLMPIGGMIPALAECDRRCGVPMSGLATAEGCKCWDAKRKTSHGVGAWVALR